MQDFDWVGVIVYVGWWYAVISLLKILDCFRHAAYAAKVLRDRAEPEIPYSVYLMVVVVATVVVVPLCLPYLMYVEGFRFLLSSTEEDVYEQITGEEVP